MFSSIQELSKLASVKQLNNLASSISAFLLCYYKDEGKNIYDSIIIPDIKYSSVKMLL